MTLQDLASAMLRSCAPFGEDERGIISAAYRTLRAGSPAPLDRIARSAGRSLDTVANIFARRPGLARVDGTGAVHGILGLSALPTPHRLEVDGRALYAWCAWDTLFLPRILGSTVRVESRCPMSGHPVRLLVTPAGPSEADPAGVLVSMVTAACDPERGAETVAVCCEHTHFLATVDAAERWRRGHPDGIVLSLADAAELVRMFVETSLAPQSAGQHEEVG
jgi:alkylmercury lyase